MDEKAVRAAREFFDQMMDFVRKDIPALKSQYGEDSHAYVAFSTLVDILSKYHAHAVDLYGFDEYSEIPEDRRDFVLPDGTAVAYVLTMDVGRGIHWYRVRGVAPGAEVSGMYAKATDALVLGTAALDAVLSDYVSKEQCRQCSKRDDCRTIALFEFARGLVGAMVDRGYDPMQFMNIYLAAAAYEGLGVKVGVAKEGGDRHDG